MFYTLIIPTSGWEKGKIMTFRLGTIRKTEFFRIISIIILINFSLTVLIPNSYAQIASLPASELGLATAFVPPLLKGIKVDLNKPFNFDFVLDTGSNRQQTTANGLKDESTKLIKYFLASLAIPEKDLWVNLNPKEPDRIVSNEFGQTEMGRDLLAQDYIKTDRRFFDESGRRSRESFLEKNL